MLWQDIIFACLDFQEITLVFQFSLEVTIHLFERNEIFAPNGILLVGEACDVISIRIAIVLVYDENLDCHMCILIRLNAALRRDMADIDSRKFGIHEIIKGASCLATVDDVRDVKPESGRGWFGRSANHSDAVVICNEMCWRLF